MRFETYEADITDEARVSSLRQKLIDQFTHIFEIRKLFQVNPHLHFEPDDWMIILQQRVDMLPESKIPEHELSLLLREKNRKPPPYETMEMLADTLSFVEQRTITVDEIFSLKPSYLFRTIVNLRRRILSVAPECKGIPEYDVDLNDTETKIIEEGCKGLRAIE